jgi:hypothetical protein
MPADADFAALWDHELDRKLAEALKAQLQDSHRALEFARACGLPEARAILHRNPRFRLAAAEVVKAMQKLAYALAEYRERGFE